MAAEPQLRLAFVAPAGARWLLPLYELALLAAAELREYAIDAPDVMVATPSMRRSRRSGRPSARRCARRSTAPASTW